ncbi:MAG TPA: MarR family transcriptional regulator [Syntrophorhabdaceae bacterium]|nr:MarR family transcriptional regulator [Syntrophorhabdaceae bacterium]
MKSLLMGETRWNQRQNRPIAWAQSAGYLPLTGVASTMCRCQRGSYDLATRNFIDISSRTDIITYRDINLSLLCGLPGTKNMKNPDRQLAKSSHIDKALDELHSMYFSRLMALSDIVNRYVDIALKDEVNWLRLRALVVLTGLGKGAINSSELAKNLLRPNQNITRIVDDLERDGLVAKVRDRGDRRVITVRITRTGLDYISQSLDRIATAEKELRFCLNRRELGSIATMLPKVRRHLAGLLSDGPNRLRTHAGASGERKKHGNAVKRRPGQDAKISPSSKRRVSG